MKKAKATISSYSGLTLQAKHRSVKKREQVTSRREKKETIKKWQTWIEIGKIELKMYEDPEKKYVQNLLKKAWVSEIRFA